MTGAAVETGAGRAPVSERGVAVEARGLTRRFGSHLALDALTLRIAPGESFALLGENGAGKTTFIRLVTGFLLPSAGSITVDGVSPALHPEQVHARLGFVMETSRLYPELSVRGFLRFMGGARGLAGAALARAVDVALARFHLEGVAPRLVGNLSKGYQQRVSLAQAFLADPPLVIVDEPTGGLDPVQRGEVQALLGSLRGERTLILCTHDLGEARTLAARVGVLNAGRLVAEGEASQLLEREDALALFRSAAEPAG
ncbi:MAG TPA: ABC transporter ATP-binding protein [Myxococcota bacterium]|jgi:ABC-2 type transport system ATP-binding protein